LKNWT